MLFLAIHQHVQQHVVEEMQQVFYDESVDVSYETLSHLTYTEMVIKETLRLCPSVGQMGRELQEDMIIDGHRIPKGTEVISSIFALHHREDVWGPDAETFDPDRFLPANLATRHQYAWIPFSVGTRNCIGYRYAMVSLKVMMVHLLRRYKFNTTLKWSDIRWELDVHLHLTTPYFVSIEPRDFYVK